MESSETKGKPGFPPWFTYQETKSGAFRSQPRNPVTGRTVSLTCRDLGELFSKVQAVHAAKNDLKYSGAAPCEVSARIDRTAYGALSIDEVWKEWVDTRSEATRGSYESAWNRHLAPTFGGLGVYALTESAWRKWAVDRREKGKLSAASVRWMHDCLLAAFKLGVRAGRLSHVPWGDYRPPRPKRDEYAREGAGNLEEFEALILTARAADERKWSSGRYACDSVIVVVLGLCGLRQAEACGLGWDCVDVDSDRPSMLIEAQARRRWRTRTDGARPEDDTKSRRSRRLAIHPSVVDSLRWLREELRRRGWYRTDGPVFPNPKTGDWRDVPIVLKPETFRAYVEAAGLQNVSNWTTHSLRHTCGTLEVNSGDGDLKGAQMRLGHSSVEQTAKYVRMARRGAPSAIGALSTGLVPSVPVAPPPQLDVWVVRDDGLRSLVGATAARFAEVEAERAERDRARTKELRERVSRRVTDEGAMLALVRELSDVELVQAGKAPPRSVKDGAAHAYRVAYSREIYHVKEMSKDVRRSRCIAAGCNAQRGVLGLFGRLRSEEMQKRGFTVDKRDEQNERRRERRRKGLA